jgi:hypothetical protein
MGDEGLQIFKVDARKVSQVNFLSWEDPNFIESATQSIVKQCKRAKILVFNDMVEQHYRKERIPKVSFFDQKNVLQRRLNIAFPNYRVRAALKLKDKKTPAVGEKKGNPYLFAAVPASDSFRKVLEAVRASMAPIDGFYLLPVEASSIVSALSKKISKSSRSTWTIFVGQHHKGNLRQIVTRNNELALTRLTPIVDTDVEPDIWATEVSEELDATMSYLLRFGYKPEDGLNIIIVTNQSAKTSLESAINVDADIHLLTADEIARTLKIKIGKQEDGRYADPVHVASLSKKKSFTLPLSSPAISDLVKVRKFASLAMFVILGGIAYLSYSAFQNYTKYSEAQNKLTVAQQKTESISSEYAVELGKQKALGFDFLLVDNAISIHGDFERNKLKPLAIIEEIGNALENNIRLEKIDIQQKIVELNERQARYSEERPNNIVSILLTISFPGSVDTKVSVQQVNELRNRLAENLLDYEVSVQKQVADLSYTGNFSGGTSVNSVSETPENYEAIIEILGELND